MVCFVIHLTHFLAQAGNPPFEVEAYGVVNLSPLLSVNYCFVCSYFTCKRLQLVELDCIFFPSEERVYRSLAVAASSLCTN